MSRDKSTAVTYADDMKKYFSVSVQQPGEPLYPFSSADFLTVDGRERIIGLQSTQLGDPGLVIVGMLFAKRYSVFCMGVVSALSLYDAMLDIRPENVRLRVTEEAQMDYQITGTGNSMQICGHTGHREEAANYLYAFFTQHIGSVFQAVSKHTGARLSHMWSIVSNNIQNMYLRIEDDAARYSKERKKIIATDKEMLFDHLRWRVSGLPENRLAIRFKRFDHPEHSGQSFYLRKHCCLAYKIRHEGEAHGYCITCPHASAEERIKKLRRE